MVKPVTITLLLNTEGTMGRSILRGFNRIALQSDWLLQHYPPQAHAPGTAFPLEQDADAFVLGPGALGMLPPHLARKRRLVWAEENLSHLGIPGVGVDNRPVGVAAAAHLLETGVKHFATFGFDNHVFAAERIEGFRSAIAAAGLMYHPGGDQFTSALDHPARHASRAHVSRWLRRLPKPVGIFAPCDNWARMLLTTCRAMGLRVPEEICVVGADNDEVACELLHPTLSSVIIPWERVGEDVARLLREALGPHRDEKRPGGVSRRPGLSAKDAWRESGRAPSHRVPPAGIVKRHSSDLLAVEDENVAAALAWIRAHAATRLTIPDLLRQVPTHRRALERAFRRTVGRSILQEMQRVHVEQAKRLLAMTHLPAEVVARQAGFASAKRMTVAFHRELRTTPRGFRRQIRGEHSAAPDPAGD